MILIKNAHVYGPDDLGIKQIIIAFDRIYALTENIPSIDFDEVFDAKGKIVMPGLIDQHIHITGGGGEGGYRTKVPEIQLSKLVEAGITTVVGLLGTDSVTRSPENLVAKALALTEEGILTYALTGSYAVPSPTITGSIKKDIVFVDHVIGVKVAANDHRDSAIQAEELARIGAEARVAGMISGKSGHVTIHMGGGKFSFQPLRQALALSNLPIATFRPTHVNRSEDLFKDALDFAREGGYIDATSDMGGDLDDLTVFQTAKKAGLLDQLTFSSDGFGSWSEYDEEGNLTDIGYSPVNTSLAGIRAIAGAGEPFEEVIQPYTSTVARLLKLDHQLGFLKPGYLANLLVMNEDYSLHSVMSLGKWMMQEEKILVRGTYE